MSFLVKDPCGYVCIFLTYAAVFYADYVVIRWVVLQTMQNSLWGSLHVVLFNTIIFFVSMAHLRAMCSDPGTVPLPQTRMDFSDIHSGFTVRHQSRWSYFSFSLFIQKPVYLLASESADLFGLFLSPECSGALSQSEDWTVCTRCETYRPPRAHHCRICKRCIRRMDHHCPWINNCVGERNQKYFLQFLMYVGVLVAYAMALVVMSLVRECPGCEDDLSLKQSRILHCVLLMVESLLFGMFVAAMLVDQLSAILGDETAVEQASHQGPYRPHKPRLALLTEVCGRTHPLLWLLPCDIADTKPYHSDTQSLITHDV